jgi:hypothetical protein
MMPNDLKPQASAAEKIAQKLNTHWLLQGRVVVRPCL